MQFLMRGVMPSTVSAFAILTTIHINNVGLHRKG